MASSLSIGVYLGHWIYLLHRNKSSLCKVQYPVFNTLAKEIEYIYFFLPWIFCLACALCR